MGGLSSKKSGTSLVARHALSNMGKVTDIIQFAPASGRHPVVEGRTKEESNGAESINEPDENSLPTVRLFTRFYGRGNRGLALTLSLNLDYASLFSWLP